jgi:cysteine desulfurase
MLVNRCGCVDASQFLDRFQSDTRFVTLMLANNETGALQPVAALANLAIERAIPVHTDAVQAVGRIPIHFHELGVTTLAASAHKFHGPTGIGVLLVRSGTRLGSRLFGGGQQHGRRPGTVPVALVVGMATALQRWHQEADARIKRWQALRDRLEAGLIANLGTDRIIRNGPADQYQRLPQTLNLGFLGLNGDTFLMQLDLAGIAASIGSACASGSTRLSPTLLAMHVPDECIQSSVRFSLGAQTTRAEVEQAIERITRIVLAQATLE